MNLPHWPAQNFRDTAKIYVIRNCQWNILYMSNLKVTWSLGPKAHPGLAHQWVSNWEPFNSVLCAIPLCQPPHIKNKKNSIWKLRILLWFTQLEKHTKFFLLKNILLIIQIQNRQYLKTLQQLIEKKISAKETQKSWLKLQ